MSASDLIAITIGIQLAPNTVVLRVEPLERNSANPHVYTAIIHTAGGYYVNFRYYDYAVFESRTLWNLKSHNGRAYEPC